MENLLELYGRSPEPGQVRLCMDERPCQLLADILAPLPMKPGSSKRQDYEYKRNGSCVIFMAYDIDRGIRYVAVKQRRTKADYAAFIDQVLKQYYPEAEKVELVQDNLNTHNYGSFYENLPLERAAELRQLIRFHYTPKHGSWLNMVEIEFSAFSRQCLEQRVGSMEKLEQSLTLWVKDRNKKQVKIHWSFTVENAREKLNAKYQQFKI